MGEIRPKRCEGRELTTDQLQAKAGGDAEAIQRTADAEREKRMRMEQELAGQQEKER